MSLVSARQLSPENQCKKNGNAQGCQSISSNRPDHRLIEDTKHGDDVDELWLADEFRKDSNVVEGPLGVRVSHCTIQKVEDALPTRVIECYT